MAGLSGEIKEVVRSLDQVTQAVGVANVRNVNLKLVRDPFEIVAIPAVIWQQAVHYRNLRAHAVESPGQVGADKAQAARDQHLRSLKLLLRGG
jgi:hypothetical protein